jgi:hypothetical protein
MRSTQPQRKRAPFERAPIVQAWMGLGRMQTAGCDRRFNAQRNWFRRKNAGREHRRKHLLFDRMDAAISL